MLSKAMKRAWALRENKCRLSLREGPFFRRANDDSSDRLSSRSSLETSRLGRPAACATDPAGTAYTEASDPAQ